MPVVQNTVTDPSGAPIKGARVHVRLIASTDGSDAAGYLSDDTEILGEWRTATDRHGFWSLTLTANTLVDPGGTYYAVTEIVAGRPGVTQAVVVPNGAGPYLVHDILTLPLPTLDPLTASQSEVDAIEARVTDLESGGVTLGPLTYTHSQATPSTTWNVVHNLGYRPNVALRDSGGAPFGAIVTHVDVNTLTVTLTSAIGGFADLS